MPECSNLHYCNWCQRAKTQGQDAQQCQPFLSLLPCPSIKWKGQKSWFAWLVKLLLCLLFWTFFKHLEWYPSEKSIYACSVFTHSQLWVFRSAGRRWDDFEEWLLPINTSVLVKMLQGRTKAGSCQCCNLACGSLCDCSVAQWPSLISGAAAFEPFCPGQLMSLMSLGITEHNFWQGQEGVGAVRALTAHKIQARWHPSYMEWWGFRPAKSTCNCILPPARHQSWDFCHTIPTEHHLCLLWLLKNSVFDLLALNTTLLHSIIHRYKFKYFFLDRQ